MERDRNIKETRSPKQNLIMNNEALLMDPESRLRFLSDKASRVEIDYNIKPRMYFRSGIEMIRQADIYRRENSLEPAYLLYVKYLTIFLEKIQKHPELNTVPAKARSENKETLRKIWPIVDELKSKLLTEFKNEAIKYNAAKKEREKSGAKDTNLKPNAHDQIPAQVSNDADKYIPNSSSTRKDGLRNVNMPTKLIREFLNFASSNTVNNKETCGILAGKLDHDSLFITHLLLPKQSGSSDSCVTHNEEEIFDYQDQHNLITLGWIHTHPTQTAFLSSVDLHTHCSYQLMMAEAIAIVCAPKYDETGYFTLTPDHGLNFVARCRATGFHPHPNEQSLYMHAQHCKLDPNANVHVVDLTKK